MVVQLRVLGCFELRVDGVRADVSPVPARILAYLALQPDVVWRSALANVLWPTVPHERALGNLRSALWRLPRGARDTVAETGSSLRLADHVDCDLAPLHRGLAAMSAEMSADVQDVLAWAWGDELLAGWYDDWVLAAREALQVRRAVLLENLSTTSCADGRSGDALTFATFAVGAQPLRESAHRSLLRAHLDVGHRREAVELYAEFARILQHELGVGPSPETAALVADSRGEIA